MKRFVNTWGWLALADRNDTKRRVAADGYRERSKQRRHVVTSNFVVGELLTLLFLRLPFAEAVEFSNAILACPSLVTERVAPDRFRTTMAFRLKLADKPGIFFRDLTSMVIMKELGISDELTTENHFVPVRLGFHNLPE